MFRMTDRDVEEGDLEVEEEEVEILLSDMEVEDEKWRILPADALVVPYWVVTCEARAPQCAGAEGNVEVEDEEVEVLLALVVRWKTRK